MNRRYWNLALLAAAVPFLRAQASEFEAASVRLNTDGPPFMPLGLTLRGGRMAARMFPLRQIIGTAYGLPQLRVFGPAWMDSSRYDIVAKSPAGVPDTAFQPMLQSLLRDRFKLVAHLEKRELPVYHLVVGKGGVKMPLYPAHEPPKNPSYGGGHPMITGSGLTMAQLADMMSDATWVTGGRNILDKTGLKGRYSIMLEYSFISQAAGATAEFGPPDLFAAVQQQLGLKLEASKDSLDVVVVDHVERIPTEN